MNGGRIKEGRKGKGGRRKEGKGREGEKGRKGGKQEERKIAQSVMVQECLI